MKIFVGDVEKVVYILSGIVEDVIKKVGIVFGKLDKVNFFFF